MTARRVWHLWPSRQWPSSPAEEAALITALQVAAEERAHQHPGGWIDPLERHDVTAVLNALRCGLGADELLTYIPGAEPANLVAAYQMLAIRLRETRTAWAAIVAEPTWAVVETHGAAAAVLLPVPVHRILTAAALTGGKSLASATAAAAAVVAQHGRVAARLEAQLATLAPGDRRGPALGARLHNPVNPGLWGSPYYLPDRVAALSPTRVADLLGERTAPDTTLE